MNLEQIKKLRELHGEETLFLFTDNAKLCDARLDKTHILWDDNNEIIHTVRPNTNFYSQSKEPIIVESSAYETIQCISSIRNKEQLEVLLNTLKNDGIIDDEKISMILAEYKK